MITSVQATDRHRTYRIVFYLAIFTIAYNLIEGLWAVYFGQRDGSLALFGFGLDSFIEMISGIGIVQMIHRMSISDAEQNVALRTVLEKNALRITGTAFYILAVVLIFKSLWNIYAGHQPETTFWGIVIACISIILMIILYFWKRNLGRALDSQPIIADAKCSLVCMYMSFILLVSSFLYSQFQILHIDSIATLGLAYFCYAEGKEALLKVKDENYSCSCHE